MSERERQAMVAGEIAGMLAGAGAVVALAGGLALAAVLAVLALAIRVSGEATLRRGGGR